ncbi:O-antigen ligase family protein [Paenarthrobacter sp. DKR-5]|uniref:O-antigen ligase family protein n=1 Tax=Paenarthrobacter sp. DKR-5 TaxID=2835535 RepID=UPI001BDC781B|nr:O-antigen ligase family protein [Paenarthrobacter sp. DKR-5]MBT1002782.1 O-antigen ligase family protein [Paenarthrobacter sp. DKR-5]
MMPLILAFLAVVTLAIVLYASARVLQQHPTLGLVLSAAITMTVWEVPSPPPIVHAFGVNIFLLDALSVLFALSTVFNFWRLGVFLRGTRFSWIAFLLMLCASVISGIGSLGANTAVNEARGILYLVCSTMWVCSLAWEKQEMRILFHRYAFHLGWGLVALASYHAIRFGIGGASDFVDADGVDQTGRVLVAGQAMVLALASLVLFENWLKTKSKASLIGTSAFAFVVLIAQNRSVWAAAGAGFILLIIRSDRFRRPAALAYVVVLAWAALVIIATGIANGEIQQLASSASNASTYNARTFSWSYLTDNAVDRGLATVMFGQPFGVGYARVEPNGNFVTFQPHNIYVSLFLRLGALGLALYLFSMLVPLMRHLKQATTSLNAGILGAILVYGWAYGPIWYVHIFLGFSLIATSTPDTLRTITLHKKRARSSRARSKPDVTGHAV